MSGTGKIRVLLADDHTLIRQGLRALFEKEADVKVVGEARHGREAVHLVLALKPDVVVMDISMPRLNGFEATQRIKRASPGTWVVALTVHGEEHHVRALLQAGARGYIPKEAPFSDLLAAVRAVHAGGYYLHPAISGRVVDGYLDGSKPPEGDDLLTPREREVLQLVSEGYTNRRIATELGLSIKTVEAHRARVMTKLKIHNAAGLTRYALSRGMTDDPAAFRGKPFGEGAPGPQKPPASRGSRGGPRP
ncbi:MAG TPA: response regulator transcription factor [Candidatus Polarisedimenticolia bacterium]|nr:response regulator transcription factor [Candidatus Polarisedimenticolia bacterium]